MKKILFTLLALLLFSGESYAVPGNPYTSVQQAGQVISGHSVTWKSTNQIQDSGSTPLTLPVPNAIGGLGMNTDCGLLSSATNNSTAWNAWVTAYVATAIANNTTWGFAPCINPPATYKITNQVIDRPYIQNEFYSSIIDATGIAVNGTSAFRLYNTDAPASSSPSGGDVHSASNAPFLSGVNSALLVKGPGAKTAAVTTIVGSVGTSDTTITVASAGALPGSGPYYISLTTSSKTEVLQVTAGYGTTTLTVARNQFGTIPNSYSTGQNIDQLNTVIGADIGDPSGTSTSGQYDVRNTGTRNVTFNSFDTCIYLRNTNTYVLDFEDTATNFCNFGLKTENMNAANSGESDKGTNITFNGGVNGYLAQGNSVEMHLRGGSVDFMSGSCIFLTGTATHTTTYLEDYHFEHCEGGIAKSDMATLTGQTVVIRNGIYVPSSYWAHHSSPWQAAFGSNTGTTGKMRIDVDGLLIGYAFAWYDANVGLFMADPNQTILQLKNIWVAPFTFSQLTSYQQVANEDPFFANGTAGTINSTNLPNYTVSSSSGITGTVDTANVFTLYNASAKSLNFTSTAGSNFFVFNTSKIKTRPGQKWAFDTTFYGGASTGTDAVQLQCIFTASSGNLPQTTDGSAFGDNMSTDYNDATYPGYNAGLRTAQYKMANLRNCTVPTGYDQVQLSTTVSSMASGGETVWITGVAGTPLN